MPGPTLHDDGSSVTLDLHGATVEEALDLARASIREAARRGRQTVKLIHGASTSSTLYRNRTIKHELQSLIESGETSRFISTQWQGEGYLLLGIVTSGSGNPARIRLEDVMP